MEGTGQRFVCPKGQVQMYFLVNSSPPKPLDVQWRIQGGGGGKNFHIGLFHFHGEFSEFLILVPLNSLNNMSLVLPLIPASF